jgi:RNA polymerase sigma-70 factor (ECF subfamily)
MEKSFQISDKKLVQQYLRGNEACLEMLITRHKNKVFSTIYLIVHDQYIAEDLFQETFIKVIRTLKSGKYNEEGKFLPWVLRIGRNLAIDYFRKVQRMPAITSGDGTDIFSYLNLEQENREEQIIRTQREKTVRELIKLLPDEQREVLVLRHYGDLSFKEIAEITNVSINTALGRMRYALNNLRKIMEEKSIQL